MKIAIIGGGISGLATAYYLKEQNEELEVDIYEGEKVLGGRVKTVHKDDFHFDLGPNGFFTNNRDFIKLLRKTDVKKLLIRAQKYAKTRYLYKDGLYKIPGDLSNFLQTPLLTMAGKLKGVVNPTAEPNYSKIDESLQSFGYRRLGKNVTDTIFEAMLSEIYGTDCEKISVRSAFPGLVDIDKEARMFNRKIYRRVVKADAKLIGFKNGTSEFFNTLAEKSKSNIFLDSPAKSVRKMENNYVVEFEDWEVEYDKVVFCTPSYITASLVQNFDISLANMLRKIKHSNISIVCMGYNKFDFKLNGYGVHSGKGDDFKPLSILWDSSIFKDRAPKGKKALRVIFGGMNKGEWALQDDEELLKMAKEAVKQTTGIDRWVDTVHIERIENAIPNYTIGHQSRMKAIHESMKNHEGLYLNSNSYKGITLNACVKNSRECAEKILKK